MFGVENQMKMIQKITMISNQNNMTVLEIQMNMIYNLTMTSNQWEWNSLF